MLLCTRASISVYNREEICVWFVHLSTELGGKSAK
jgi:hypothetical protein